MLPRLREYYRLTKEFASSGDLPAWRQVLEMSALFMMRGIGPGYYLQGRFGMPGLRFSDKLQFLSAGRYVRRVHEVNDPRFHKASQHKVIEAAILTYFNIPTPKSYGQFHPETGMSCRGGPLRTADDLARLLSEESIRKFVMKPCEGSEGRGFVAAEHGDGQVRRLPASEWQSVAGFADGLVDADGGYFVQQYFEQHPTLAELNPSSINTVRMLVFRAASRTPVCFGARLRIGRAGKLVDNSSAGGIVATADLATGVVGEGYFYKPSTDRFAVHPDTGAQIAGRQIPFWEEAKEVAMRALMAIPHMKFAGLDIGFGEDGPVVIELNVQPDYGDFSVLRIPSRAALSDASYS